MRLPSVQSVLSFPLVLALFVVLGFRGLGLNGLFPTHFSLLLLDGLGQLPRQQGRDDEEGREEEEHVRQEGVRLTGCPSEKVIGVGAQASAMKSKSLDKRPLKLKLCK